jgi:hypothetical protein
MSLREAAKKPIFTAQRYLNEGETTPRGHLVKQFTDISFPFGHSDGKIAADTFQHLKSNPNFVVNVL